VWGRLGDGAFYHDCAMSSVDRISVHLFKNGGGQFRSLLKEAKVPFHGREYENGAVMAAPETLEILKIL